jgi:sugar/nucleoside kinase (ribokinase family)
VVDVRSRQPLDDGNEAPLHVLETPPRCISGGVGIVARQLSGLGRSAAVAGCVGRDLLGWGLRRELDESGVRTHLVREVDEPTSSSHIRLTREQRSVRHFIGANAVAGRQGGIPEALRRERPRVFLLAYLGLLPDMEAGGGRLAAEILDAARSLGVITVLDLHTRPDVRDLLPGLLPGADVFFCNREEAIMLSGLSGTSGGEADLLKRLWAMAGEVSRPRMFGVTGAGHACAKWSPGPQGQCGYIDVRNPHLGKVAVEDSTGAGDAFRAGLIDFMLEHGTHWAEDLATGALLAGHARAARAISARSPEAWSIGR